MAFLDAVGVVEGIIDIGCPIIKCREEKTDLRCGNHIGDATIMELFFLGDIVQRRLRLLHRANGTQQICINFAGIICLRGIILTLEGHIIAVAAYQDQVIALQADRFDDLFIEFL